MDRFRFKSLIIERADVTRFDLDWSSLWLKIQVVWDMTTCRFVHSLYVSDMMADGHI